MTNPATSPPRSDDPGPDRIYRCSGAARWLPRGLAAAVLVAAMLGAFRIETSADPLLPHVRRFVVLVGAVLAVGIVRKGREVRCTFGLTRDAIVIAAGSRSIRLELEEIQRLDWAGPFGGSLNWMPAALLIDNDGRSWRVPALVERGDELFTELLGRAARHDLEAWADAYHIVARMARYPFRVRVGYVVVAATLVAGVVYYIR